MPDQSRQRRHQNQHSQRAVEEVVVVQVDQVQRLLEVKRKTQGLQIVQGENRVWVISSLRGNFNLKYIKSKKNRESEKI